jgi:hypothetical protein
VWLLQAFAFIAVTALLAGAILPVTVRAVLLVGVLPLCTWTILINLFFGSTPAWQWRQYLTHAAVAAITALYVGGLPALVGRYPRLGRPVRSSAILHESTL